MGAREMSASRLQQWLSKVPFSETDVDCATTVMLKILDGKCKMKDDEKYVMECLYLALRPRLGLLFDAELHHFITQMRRARDQGEISEENVLATYEQRLLAETRLSRPVMKAFKARIRAEGLFELELGQPLVSQTAQEHPSHATS